MCRVYPRFSSQATRALMYMYSASLHVKNRLREMRIMFIIAKAFVFICVCVCVFNMENWCSVNCSNCLVCFVFGWFCELVSHCFTASDCLSFAISSGTNKRTNQVGSRKCVCDVCVILWRKYIVSFFSSLIKQNISSTNGHFNLLQRPHLCHVLYTELHDYMPSISVCACVRALDFALVWHLSHWKYIIANVHFCEVTS